MCRADVPGKAVRELCDGLARRPASVELDSAAVCYHWEPPEGDLLRKVVLERRASVRRYWRVGLIPVGAQDAEKVSIPTSLDSC